jgi:hypothetical protein
LQVRKSVSVRKAKKKEMPFLSYCWNGKRERERERENDLTLMENVMIWYEMLWCKLIRDDMKWYDHYDKIWYDMLRHDMIWSDMIWNENQTNEMKCSDMKIWWSVKRYVRW